MSQIPTPSSVARRLPGIAKLRVDASYGATDHPTESGQPSHQQSMGASNEQQRHANLGTFVNQDVAIWDSGVALRGAENVPKVIRPEELVVGEVIGRGASSYVQLATHGPTGQLLALKIINIFDKSKRDQLIREISALYDADCDALISFWGAYTREGCIVLALEYMDCGSLADILQNHGPVPEPVLAAMAFQILWGLAYLRVEKRLHRDLKPGNVLVSSSGAVKLGDFGLSAELANSIGMAQTYVGTCKYMAPERISHHGYSFPSDIWSAGLILLEAALGCFPLPEASSYIDMVVTIVDVPDVLDIPPTATSATGAPFTHLFRDFIQRCLRKHPETRAAADVLLTHPWLAHWGISSLEESWAMVSSYASCLKSYGTSTGKRCQWALPPQFAQCPGNVHSLAATGQQPVQARVPLPGMGVDVEGVGMSLSQPSDASQAARGTAQGDIDDDSMGGDPAK